MMWSSLSFYYPASFPWLTEVPFRLESTTRTLALFVQIGRAIRFFAEYPDKNAIWFVKRLALSMSEHANRRFRTG